MFNERLRFLYQTFHLNNTEIAKHAGCSPSHISRIYSGARVPSIENRSLARLVDGIYSFAVDHNIIDELCTFCACTEKADSQYIKNALKYWLYDSAPIPTLQNIPIPEVAPVKTNVFRHFALRLNSLMTVLSLSNVQLSKQLRVDSSHISRFRNGVRIPKPNAPLSDLLCTALIERMMEGHKIAEVASLLNVEPALMQEPEESIHLVANWLYEVDSDWNSLAIDHLLQHIKNLTPTLQFPMPSLNDIALEQLIVPPEKCYYYTVGLQTAVIRLLSSAIRSHAKELWLYSDQNIDWLTKDNTFRMQWYALMYQCVTQGIRIKIIHHISRDIPEMLTGIESWLSLYMSGTVESYYCPKSAGSCFSHTLFLCPGVGGITGFHIIGTEEEGSFHYYEEDQSLEHLQSQYTHLLTLCKPLVHTHLLSSAHKDDIEIVLKDNTVTVIRGQKPYVAFVFSHPLMYQAFLEYQKTHTEGQLL